MNPFALVLELIPNCCR